MPRTESHCRRRGTARSAFTLVEVVVTIAIGGLAVLVAAASLATASDGVATVTEMVREHDESANGERLLRRLIGQMTWTADSQSALEGGTATIRFASWCEVPSGWQERCHVELRLRPPDSAEPGVDVRTSLGESLLLMRGRDLHGFLYLESPEQGGTWRGHWAGGASLPAAVGIVRDADTLLVRTGSRG